MAPPWLEGSQIVLVQDRSSLRDSLRVSSCVTLKQNIHASYLDRSEWPSGK